MHTRGRVSLLHAHRDGFSGGRQLPDRKSRSTDASARRILAARVRARLMSGGGEAAKAGAKELRTFGLVLGALFAAFFGVWPLLRHRGTHLWPWILAVVLWLFALIWPT